MTELEEYLLVVDEPKYINEFTNMRQCVIEYALVIEQFQKLLGVYTTTEALAKVAVLMREEDTAGKLLSKALGHLHSCGEEGSRILYNEIASAFGEAVEQSVQSDSPLACPHCKTLLADSHDQYCPLANTASR
jgi:hypothetical protein